jgi:sugar phosphate isomerase/epimerase
MANRLGCNVIILHIPKAPANPAARSKFEDCIRRSLDEMEPVVTRAGVRIAIENMVWDNFLRLHRLFKEFPADYLGLCYDSGHGNIHGDGLDQLEKTRDRLISVHLHDNDGKGDQHRLLFGGTIDWQRLARIIADSSYKKCVSLEVSMQDYGGDNPMSEKTFLRKAFKTGARFAEMIGKEKALLKK